MNLVPDCINKPIEEALTPLAHNIGKTLGDLWLLAMGGISQCAAEREIKYSYKLEQLKKSLEEKVQSTPLENRIEPNLQIACQALEDAKYCAENDDIREMFANLIATTMDNRTYQKAHPSYSAILKQMTPQEAIFFKDFTASSDIPICNFLLKHKERTEYNLLLENAFFRNESADLSEVRSTAFIISSLERLGLIQTTYKSFLYPRERYRVYRNSNIFKEFIKDKKKDEDYVDILEGIAYLTVLGQNFLDVCCPQATSQPNQTPNT